MIIIINGHKLIIEFIKREQNTMTTVKAMKVSKTLLLLMVSKGLIAPYQQTQKSELWLSSHKERVDSIVEEK
jgi:hypothetical protein